VANNSTNRNLSVQWINMNKPLIGIKQKTEFWCQMDTFTQDWHNIGFTWNLFQWFKLN
jgi:hypothetical protein